MAESYRRCRFYPGCAVHPGDPPPRQFSVRAIRDMRYLRAEGLSLREIARRFDTTAQTVWRHVGRLDRSAVSAPAGSAPPTRTRSDG